jgi:hypothetical protein
MSDNCEEEMVDEEHTQTGYPKLSKPKGEVPHLPRAVHGMDAAVKLMYERVCLFAGSSNPRIPRGDLKEEADSALALP